MKIEAGMVGVIWDYKDKTMVAPILGTKAFDYLFSSSVSAEGSLMAMGKDENLQNKLSDLVEHPNANNLSWNYAIFWKISQSRSSDLVLRRGDGCCREPRDGEETEFTPILSLRLEDETQQRMRKRVLQNCIHALAEQMRTAMLSDWIGSQILELFFLASMYFSKEVWELFWIWEAFMVI